MSAFKLDPLTRIEEDLILDAALEILEKTGVFVQTEKALNLLRDAGCEIDGNLVKIKRGLTERCFKSAPDYIEIYNRDGEHAMSLGGENVYYGPGVTCPYVFDPYTGERKEATKQFVKDVATVADALPEIDYLMSLCLVSDVTPLHADLQEVHALLSTSPKPIVTWAFNAKNLKGIVEMFHAVSGGSKQFAEKPFAVVYNEPVSPLTHPTDAMEKLLLLAEHGVPSIYSTGMKMGVSSPATLAGTLALGLADSFVGLVISQLVKEGTPIVLGASGGPLDMRTMNSTYSNPEMSMLESAASQIYRRLGIPSFGLAGATDGKSMCLQESADVTIQCLISTLSRSNLVHDFGMTDTGMTGSIDMMVFCAELAAISKFISKGIEVNEETLALDVIHNVGPGGMFLSEKHTYRNFKSSFFFPEYVPRITYDKWVERGEKTTKDLIREKTLKILKEHQPVAISAGKKELLDSILEQYAKSEDEMK